MRFYIYIIGIYIAFECNMPDNDENFQRWVLNIKI